MAPDIGMDQFIMSGLQAIGGGIITTKCGITATTEFTTNGGGSVSPAIVTPAAQAPALEPAL